MYWRLYYKIVLLFNIKTLNLFLVILSKEFLFSNGERYSILPGPKNKFLIFFLSIPVVYRIVTDA